MKTSTTDELSKRIERVIQEHIKECHQAAQAALSRAFAVPGSGVRAATSSGTKAKLEARKRATWKCRTAAELSATAEKLFESICASPGDTMAALALWIGVSSQELQTPMASLKRDEKVRHVGARSQTRYFPLTTGTA